MAWTVVDNPAWAGRTPSRLSRSDCHDHSHLITIECSCGGVQHIHETQITGAAPTDEIASRCKNCWDLLIFPAGQLQAAFAELRRQGWIA